MKIEISSDAAEDLLVGFYFYEGQSPGVGDYFLDTLFSDIDSLTVFAGIHRVVFGKHRCLSKRFPYAIYYVIQADVVQVRAVLDCRQNPLATKRRLQGN